MPAQEDDASSPDLDAGGQGGARPPLGDLVDAADADTPHSIDMGDTCEELAKQAAPDVAACYRMFPDTAACKRLPLILAIGCEQGRFGKWPADAKTGLRIIGSAALMLQADYERGTKDTDVLKTRDLSQETKQQLLELAGRGTEIHKRHRV